MKHLNKIASVFCVAAMALTALTGCEGSDMFSVNGPDWLSEKIDSIANSNKGTAPTISPTTLGATDNSDAWMLISRLKVISLILRHLPTILLVQITITTML